MRLFQSTSALALALTATSAALPQVDLSIRGVPSVHFAEAPLVSPGSAQTYYNAQPGALTSPAIIPDRDPRIEELADSLNLNATPWEVYTYVRDHIEITPQFGLQKGAFGAILDGYGNPFDQAHLMVELLRENGRTASYRMGEIEFTGSQIADFTSWLGPETARGACEMLSGGGIPALVNGTASADCTTLSNAAGSLTSVRMMHVWVMTDLGNGWRAYDPSFKNHFWTEPHALLDTTLPAASAYRSATGGTIGTYSGVPAITGMNANSVSSLETQLTTATTNLLNQLQSPANMDQSLVEIAGGMRIDEAHQYHPNLDIATAAHPYEFSVIADWTGEIPTSLRATVDFTLQLHIGGASASVTKDVWELAGRRITLVPDTTVSPGGPSTSSATLFLDEASIALAQFPHGCPTCTVDGYGVQISTAIDHPYAAYSGTFMDETLIQPASDVVPSVLMHSWGDRGTGAEARNTSAYAGEGTVQRDIPQHANLQISGSTCTNVLSLGTDVYSETISHVIDTLVIVAPGNDWPPLPGPFPGHPPPPGPHPSSYGNNWTIPDTITLVNGGSSEMFATISNCVPEFEDVAQLPFHTAQMRTKMQMAESYLARSEELLRLVDGLSQRRHVTHHAIGLATSRADLSTDGTVREDQALISVSTRLSQAGLDASARSQMAYAQASSSGLSALEAAITMEATGSTEANSTASMFAWFLESPHVPSGGQGSGGSRPFLLIDGSNHASASTLLYQYTGVAQGWSRAFNTFQFDMIMPLSGRLGPVEDSIRFVNEQRGGADYWRRLGSAYIAYRSYADEINQIAHMATTACGTDRYLSLESTSCTRLPLKGSGGATFPTEINAPTAEQDYLAEQYDSWASSFSVDVGTGAMTFTAPADIETGAGGYPYSLAFQRTYNSQSRSPGPLGTGWSHNFETRLTVGTDVRSATRGTAQQAAATIVAAEAVLDLFDGSSNEIDMVRALLVQNWWAESLINNSATIQSGSGSQTYYYMPDGDYISTPGSTTTLERTGTITVSENFAEYSEATVEPWTDLAYQHVRAFDYSGLSFTLTGADGTVRHFSNGLDKTYSAGILPAVNPGGSRIEVGSHNTFRPTTSFYPNGITVSYTYQNDALHTVSNSLGRQLTFNYVSTNVPDPTNPGDQPPPGTAPHGPALVLASVSDENNRSVSFGLSLSGATPTSRQLDSVTDPENHVHSYQYLIQDEWRASSADFIAAPAKRTLLTEVRLPHAPTTAHFTFTYDVFGRILTSKDADNRTTTYGVGEGAIGITRNHRGFEQWSYFDQDGNPIASIDARRSLTLNEFDGIGRQVKSFYVYDRFIPETQNWARSETDYDQYNNVIETRQLPRSTWSGSPLVTRHFYNHPGNPTLRTRTVDPRSNIAEIICYSSATLETGCSGLGLDANDRGGLPQATLGPSGETTLISYNAIGLPTLTRTQVEASEWRATSATYYGTGPSEGLPQTSRVHAVVPSNGSAPSTSADDLVTSFTWHPTGDLASVTDPRGADATATYDNNRRLLTMTVLPGDADLRQYSEFDYNASGWLNWTGVSVDGTPTGQLLKTTVTYTASGQLQTLMDPDDGVAAGEQGQSFEYQGDGLLSAMIDGAGRRTEHRYSALGRRYCTLSGVGTPDIRTTWFVDILPWGDIVREHQSLSDRDFGCNNFDAGEDPRHEWSTEYSVDAFLRRYVVTYANEQSNRTDHDENGNPYRNRRLNWTGSAWVEAWRHDTVFDASNRPEQVTTPEDIVTTQYNRVGQPTRVERFGDSWLEYEYDFAGRVIEERRSDGISTHYEYDKAGNRTAIRWDEGGVGRDDYVARYVYNLRGELIYVEEDRDNDGASERVLAEYVYDRLGRLIETHLAGEDPHGSGQGAGSLAATSGIAYTYEIDGELTQMEHAFDAASGVIFTYDYNGAGQLTHEAASASGWLWDAPGPAESWSFASTDAVRPGEPTNNMNQYGSFTHTVDGTPTTATFSYDLYDNMSGDGTRVFTHDTRNRLISVAQPGLTITYEYDVIGRRVSETHNSSHVAGYVHAGGIEIGEIDDQGRLIRIYVPGPGTDQRVSMIGLDPATQAVTSRHYYHANRQGSVIAMADQTGAVTDQYVYTPFGVETPFASSGNPFRYTGQRVDHQTGLYYYRARYYWPDIGRFLQTDPIGHADQLNLYAYVANDPLNLTDPTGMFQEQGGQQLAQIMMERLYIHQYNNTPAANVEARAEIAMQLYFIRQGTLGMEGSAEAILKHDASMRPRTGMDPSTIHFTQATHSERFSTGETINQTARQLASGAISPGDLPPIRVFTDENGLTRTIDHRRLVAVLRANEIRASNQQGALQVSTVPLAEVERNQGPYAFRATYGRYDSIISTSSSEWENMSERERRALNPQYRSRGRNRNNSDNNPSRGGGRRGGG